MIVYLGIGITVFAFLQRLKQMGGQL